MGECDKCGAAYELSSKDNRCGDCGNCSGCCDHVGEGEINKCAVCGSNTETEFGKIKDSHYGIQFVCELACWDSYEGWYCDTCLLLHDHGTTMESDNSCQKESE